MARLARYCSVRVAVVFRPCIDLHDGKVKQVVGGDLDTPQAVTNFETNLPASSFARRYRDDGLVGGHVIQLGAGNETAALDALGAYPGGLQLGGGVTIANAESWLSAGASHVIVTSWVFRDGELDQARVTELERLVGRDRLVLDLSCRIRDGRHWVVTDRWQRFTSLEVTAAALTNLAEYCCEFLIHAVDVEGRQAGIDFALVDLLADASPIASTYAGGARHLDDLALVTSRSGGRVDLTIGSALDLFGGTGVRYEDCVAFNQRERLSPHR